MGILFILIGVVFIGLHFYSRSTQLQEVESPPIKFIYGGSALACFGIAIYLFANVVEVGQFSAWRGFTYFVCSIGAVVAGIYLVTSAKQAEKKHSEDWKHRADKKAEQARSEVEQINLETARKKAEEESRLAEEERATQKKRLQTERRELDLRETLAETAEQKGLDVNAVIGINTTHHLAEIENNNYSKRKDTDLLAYEKEQQINFTIRKMDKQLETATEAEQTRIQLDAADRVDHSRIIDELEDKLEELMKKRRDVQKNEKDKILKQEKVARLTKRIEQLEAQIDEKQNRLLSSSDGQETKRLT